MRIAVVYVTDANYHELTLFSLASVARSHGAPLDFHLMQAGYDDDVTPTFARQINRYGHRLVPSQPSFEMPDVVRSRGKSFAYITNTTFLRAAAIESLAADYDYILYIDGDTLTFRDLHLETRAWFPEPAAACRDMISDVDTHDEFHRKPISSIKTFNGGVLLINGEAWRRYNIYKLFLEALTRHQSGCPYFSPCEVNDQCALNMALAGRWRLLAQTLNVQKTAFQTQLWADATVRHYTRFAKFLPMRLHRCDPREYNLLCCISQETGLSHPGAFYDRGLSYWLNSLRRFRDIKHTKRAIASMEND